MAVPNNVESTTKLESVNERLVNCVQSDRHIKEAILKLLPEDMGEVMKKELEEEKKLFKKYRPDEEFTEKDKGSFVAGRFFEILNYYDYVGTKFRDLKPGTSEWEEAETATSISNLLCKAARYPQEYGISIRKYDNIPDGVYTGVTKKGDYIVYGLAEAKMGALDEGDLMQVDLDGSRTTVARIVGQLSDMIDSPPKKGLHPEIAKLAEQLNGRKIQVTWKEVDGKKQLSMGLTILVPNRAGNIFDARVQFKNPSLEGKFRSMERTQRIEAKASPFTPGEIEDMTNVLLEDMES